MDASRPRHIIAGQGHGPATDLLPDAVELTHEIWPAAMPAE